MYMKIEWINVFSLVLFEYYRDRVTGRAGRAMVPHFFHGQTIYGIKFSVRREISAKFWKL